MNTAVRQEPKVTMSLRYNRDNVSIMISVPAYSKYLGRYISSSDITKGNPNVTADSPAKESVLDTISFMDVQDKKLLKEYMQALAIASRYPSVDIVCF